LSFSMMANTPAGVSRPLVPVDTGARRDLHVATVATPAHRASPAHTMRVKSTSGSTSLYSMVPGFIARRDNPGVRPGGGWQLLSRQGRPRHCGETGDRGPRGEKGERGESGATVVSWQLDRERYRIGPLMSDGKVGPVLEPRRLFDRYHEEANS
jgi:hypothetical protein